MQSITHKTVFALCLTSMMGCSEKELACTEIGCMSGLTLSFSDASGTAASNVAGVVSVNSDTGTIDIEFDCSGDGGADYFCDGNSVTIFVEEGASFSYDVHTDSLSGTGTMDLSWETSTPNGEGCEPTCYNASMDVVLDAMVDDTVE